MNNPPKYPSTPHWPWSQSVHRDDTVSKFPQNFINTEVIITEKLDGQNCLSNQGNVYARSTGAPATQGWFSQVKKYHAWKTINSPANEFIYGEDIAAKHSINYTTKFDNTYFIFAIRVDDIFLSWDNIVIRSNQIDIPMVPIIYRGIFNSNKEITSFFENEIKKSSELNNEREGFVIRNVNEFHVNDFDKNVAKYVRKNHIQSDEHWTMQWQWNKLIE